jgi:adenylyltransferase/sulfurtransferase
MYASINKDEFKNLLSKDGDNLEIIDVREENEYKIVRVENSKLIPMGDIMNNLDKINWDKKVILICRSGARSGYIAQILDSLGKKVTNMAGGIYSLELDECDCLKK